jgi:hypothetical protein
MIPETLQGFVAGVHSSDSISYYSAGKDRRGAQRVWGKSPRRL